MVFTTTRFLTLNVVVFFSAQSWPYAFQGRDVIGIAETGSGKTLGFVLPALVKLFRNK